MLSWLTKVQSATNTTTDTYILFTTYNDTNKHLNFRLITQNDILLYETNLTDLYSTCILEKQINKQLFFRVLRHGMRDHTVQYSVNNDSSILCKWLHNEYDIQITLYSIVTATQPYYTHYYNIIHDIDTWCRSLNISLTEQHTQKQTEIDNILKSIDTTIDTKNEMEYIVYNKTVQLIDTKEREIRKLNIQVDILKHEVQQLQHRSGVMRQTSIVDRIDVSDDVSDGDDSDLKQPDTDDDIAANLNALDEVTESEHSSSDNETVQYNATNMDNTIHTATQPPSFVSTDTDVQSTTLSRQTPTTTQPLTKRPKQKRRY